MWTPISIDELQALILAHQEQMNEQEHRLWGLIRVTPQKWSEQDYGEEGGGFWVVALLGQLVIWYNDIEDGFNITGYTDFGRIDSYTCDQDELYFTVRKLLRLIESGEQSLVRGGPKPLNFE